MRLLRIDLNVFNTDGAIHLSATLKQFKSRLMRLLTSWFKGIGVVALNITVVVVSVVFGFFLLNLYSEVFFETVVVEPPPYKVFQNSAQLSLGTTLICLNHKIVLT